MDSSQLDTSSLRHLSTPNIDPGKCWVGKSVWILLSLLLPPGGTGGGEALCAVGHPIGGVWMDTARLEDELPYGSTGARF